MSIQYTVMGFELTTFGTWSLPITTRPGLPPKQSKLLLYVKYSFTIISIGAWVDVSQNGFVLFHVSNPGTYLPTYLHLIKQWTSVLMSFTTTRGHYIKQFSHGSSINILRVLMYGVLGTHAAYNYQAYHYGLIKS